METPPEEQEERKYTIFECIINFANLICLSIESFADKKKPPTDRGQKPKT